MITVFLVRKAPWMNIGFTMIQQAVIPSALEALQNPSLRKTEEISPCRKMTTHELYQSSRSVLHNICSKQRAKKLHKNACRELVSAKSLRKKNRIYIDDAFELCLRTALVVGTVHTKRISQKIPNFPAPLNNNYERAQVLV